jgi:hypothetical protein
MARVAIRNDRAIRDGCEHPIELGARLQAMALAVEQRGVVLRHRSRNATGQQSFGRLLAALEIRRGPRIDKNGVTISQRGFAIGGRARHVVRGAIG